MVEATFMLVRNEPAGVGWWRRFTATVCDGLVILFGLAAPAAVLGSIYGDPGGWGEAAGAVAIVVAPLYFALLQAKSQTVGQRFTRTTVRRADSLDRLGYGRAFSRALLTLLFVLTGIVWIVDVLWPLWDKRNQALHDKPVGSIVVNVDALGYHLPSWVLSLVLTLVAFLATIRIFTLFISSAPALLFAVVAVLLLVWAWRRSWKQYRAPLVRLPGARIASPSGAIAPVREQISHGDGEGASTLKSSLKENANAVSIACSFLAFVIALRIFEYAGLSLGAFAWLYVVGVVPPAVVFLIWLGRR
jgi:hypothetical protein